MIINSAKEYRTWRKKDRGRVDVDENFMGCSIVVDGHRYNGFFDMFHGIKDDMGNFLTTQLNMAEDNQAIYEFLQNAVDCGATHFYAFYNDDYFLAVNNGTKFSTEGINSILNISQSPKKDPLKIGRLGIGFKLVHRLVGKSNGVDELIQGSKGPIMFSWDKISQLKGLISSEEIQYSGIEENAYLLKILLTNFPANVGEVVKDVNYQDTVPFKETELEELRSYANECLTNLIKENESQLEQGTLFFIKLGDNKRKLLDQDLDVLRVGTKYSMNTLRQLTHICFNGELITKKQLQLFESSIKTGTPKHGEIGPQYPDYDILFSIGYLPLNFSDKGYYQEIMELRQSPNFYKYFPMGDEVDNLALFIHCDSFDVATNRRNLTNAHINQKLLPELSQFIVDKLKELKAKDRNEFLRLYASILLSDKSNSSEKSKWMSPLLFEKLQEALKSCIPTQTGYCSDVAKVIIKKVKVDIPLDKIGHADKQWFYWSGDLHNEILYEAHNADKLAIEEWNINKIIEKADLTELNNWVDSCSEDVFNSFVNEIRTTTTTNEAKALLPQIKLHKFGKERKSRNEIDSDSKYVISTAKTTNIKTILEKVGMKCSDVPIELHPLSTLLCAQVEKTLFTNIKNTIEENATKLSASDKLALVAALNTFEDVGEESIKQLKIFNNRNGELCCLGKLVAYTEYPESWQLPYVICNNENFNEIQKYLVSSEAVYSEIIGEEYESIVDNGTSIDELYQIYQKNGHAWSSELTIKLIDKYGATEEILGLIEKTNDKGSFDEFIKKMDTLALESDGYYPPSSYIYRCIQLASKVKSTTLRTKITIDKINLTEFASSDTLTFKVAKDNKETIYCIKLSDVLPDDKQCAIYGKIVAKFTSVTEYSVVFSADSSNIGNVSQRLQKILEKDGVLISPAQYAFVLLLQAVSNSYNLCYPWYKFVRLTEVSQVAGIIAYCYDNGLMPILTSFKRLSIWSNFVQGKYLFSTDYTLKTERADKLIENWCGDDSDRRKALKDLDMHFEDCAEIKRRIAFKNDTMSAWDVELTSAPTSFLTWVKSISPVTGENQKKLLLSLCLNKKVSDYYLKQDFDETDYKDATELSSTKYSKWKKPEGIRIYTLPDSMPYRALHNNSDILCYDKYGDYHYFNDTKHLYIKGVEESEIAASLTHVYHDYKVPFSYEDYVSVCFNSLEEQRIKDEKLKQYEDFFEEIKKKEKEKEERLDEYRREYSEKVRDFMGADFSMPSDRQKTEHIISRYRILMYLKSLGSDFEFRNGFNEQDYIRTEGYAPIPLAKENKKVHPKGAKNGILYLHPNIWNSIVSNGDIGCICTGNGQFDFELIKNEDDIRKIANNHHYAYIRVAATNSMDILNTVNSLFSDNVVVGNENYVPKHVDAHLMLMVHPTPEPALNSIFDEAFDNEGTMDLD